MTVIFLKCFSAILNAIAKKYSGTYKVSCMERSARPSAYFQMRPLHFTSSPFLSFSLFLHLLAYAQAASYCKVTTHVRTDEPGSCNTPGGFSFSLGPSIQAFYFPGYANEPLSRGGVSTRASAPRADPIFSLMTHCPREQSTPRTWIACRPRIHDVSEEPELDDLAYNQRVPWVPELLLYNFYVITKKSKNK